jgi:hypothetical protein
VNQGIKKEFLKVKRSEFLVVFYLVLIDRRGRGDG